MRKVTVVLLLLLCIGASPVAGAEPDILDDRFHGVELYLTPLVPSMSSYSWTAPLNLFSDQLGPNRLLFRLWTLADTWYLVPWPGVNFFELGAQVSYVPVIRENWLFKTGIGTAVSFDAFRIAVPFYASAEVSAKLARSLWTGVLLEGFAYGNGFGIETSVPLKFYPDFFLYGAFRPAAVLYYADGVFTFNYRFGIELGIRHEVKNND